MNKALALILLLVWPAAIFAQTARRPSASDVAAEETVRSLSAKEVDGLLRNDVKVLAQIWSDDFMVTNPFNTVTNKQQVLGMTASGVLAFTSFKREIEFVRVYGDTAIVVGRESVTWAGKLPTAGEVARHANIIVGPSLSNGPPSN